MIYHEGFGSPIIRLGNYLFQIAATEKLCKTHNCQTSYQDYFLWKYLKTPPIISNNPVGKIINVRTWSCLWSKEEEQYINSHDFANKDYQLALNLFFQSENWFIDCEKEVLQRLTFKEEEVLRVKNKYSSFFDKPTIGISVRRGDFINNGQYYQIPLDWYVRALNNNFDRGLYNIIVFSDNIEEMRHQFKAENFLYCEPNNTHDKKSFYNDPMEQFILGSLLDNFIIGSSTFSWWMAWLVEKNNNGKIVHSGRYLSSMALKNNPDGGAVDESAYYPQRWINFKA